MGILIITHHDKLLEHNRPDFTHVMLGGRIVETGGPELAEELHKQGYDRIRAAYPEAAADEARDATSSADRDCRRRLRQRPIAPPDRRNHRRMPLAKANGSWLPTLITERRDIGEINKYDFRTESKLRLQEPQRAWMPQIVAQISEMKGEPDWMRDFRLKSLEIFESKPMPHWGGDIDLDFQDIYYYLKPTDHQGKTWDDVPEEIKETFDKLGIPEAEKKFLAGVKAQFESEVVYGSLQEDLGKQGRDLHRHRHGGARASGSGAASTSARSFRRPTTSSPRSTRPSGRAARSSTCPKGVKIEFPLQAYFRINAENMGQFERTLIIVDEGAEVHYVEGCTAPMYTHRKPALGRGRDHRQEARPLPLHDDPELGQQHLQPGHQAGGGLRRRADGMGRRQPGQPADDEVSGRLHDGAGRSRRDPLDRLRLGRPASGRRRQGGPLCSATRRAGSSPSRSPRTAAAPAIAAWSRSKAGAKKSKSNVVCDALILDPQSRSDTYPYIEVEEQDVSIGHEASVSRIGEEQLFYLMSRGLTEAEASTMIVNGFIEPLVKELPMEYAVEMNRLIELQMEGSVG